jgi:7,8-dihydropterin-6-yl-methyl-4-(beta-D-ribofuranosyl)aminobenzene 5'-phosphate synthase
MKITILVDNYVPNKIDLYGEPSFSCYIEDENLKILFDLGISPIPLENAKRLKIDLSEVSYIILSHGHLDHTWGLVHYVNKYGKGDKKKLLCHPYALKPKKYKRENIGIKGKENDLEEKFDIIRSKDPYWLSSHIVFLGEIERSTDFENKNPIGITKISDNYVEDFILDDSALAINTEEGITLITGCSHSGICNIIEQAKKVLNKNKIRMIIGGFHLQSEDPNDIILIKTKEYLGSQEIGIVYPCHCTNLLSKIEIAKVVSIGEIGSGTTIEI